MYTFHRPVILMPYHHLDFKKMKNTLDGTKMFEKVLIMIRAKQKQNLCVWPGLLGTTQLQSLKAQQSCLNIWPV